jgi:hypothetical protein
MALREIEWGGMEWIDLAQNKDQWTTLVNTVMNFHVPQNIGKFSISRVTSGFSRRAQLHKVSFSLSTYRVGYASKSGFYPFCFFLPLQHFLLSYGREYKLNEGRIFHSSWMNIVEGRIKIFAEDRLPLQAQYRNELIPTASFLQSHPAMLRHGRHISFPSIPGRYAILFEELHL